MLCSGPSINSRWFSGRKQLKIDRVFAQNAALITQPFLEEKTMADTPKKKRKVRAQPKRRKRDPFEPLLASLLTLDWEISDENIYKFERELKAVKKKLAADRFSEKLVDTTLPVCNYLRVKKASASPASIQFLHSATRILLRFWREKLKIAERKLEPAAARVKKKAPVRKAKKLTPAAQVLKVIKSRRKGVDVATLKKITGLTDSQVRNIIYRASRAGKIKRISRGVYISA
jgi:hypothetical protein